MITSKMIVVDKNGLQGTIAQEKVSPASASQWLVHFQNGQQALVPKEMLIRHEDGRYYLPVSIEELLAKRRDDRNNDESLLVIPVIKETIHVQTEQRETGGVEIHKTVHEHTERVDLPLASEEVEVERIAVNRIVDAPIPIRHEGDTMIISLLEEVLVVEKRLMLREEVHVRTVRKEVHAPQEVLLREERVEIHGLDGPQGSQRILKER